MFQKISSSSDEYHICDAMSNVINIDQEHKNVQDRVL